MATITRQPFAPLDGARLQSLTSLKNRQNAISPSSSVKRKASESVEIDDFENVDPTFFSKRSKGMDSFTKDFVKPSSFILTKSASTPSITKALSPVKPAAASPRPRAYLNPKSPAAKLNTSIARSTPLSAPAGRSPTRGSKRIGIISNRRRTNSPFARVDPPSFNLASAAPFSLDAALKGTIPSYTSRSSLSSPAIDSGLLHEPEAKAGWFFDIHEDTPEQEMTNLLQHSTCVLDISSDEESEQKARREKAEGRDKENIPPVDDVSQTSRAAAARGSAALGLDDMVVEKSRDPLAQLNVADFYAAGCDEASVILVPGDEEEGEGEGEGEGVPVPPEAAAPVASDAFEFAPELKMPEQEEEQGASVDELMENRDDPSKAAVLEPMEGTGESFELWESGSARDEDAVTIGAPSPAPILEDGPDAEEAVASAES